MKSKNKIQYYMSKNNQDIFTHHNINGEIELGVLLSKAIGLEINKDFIRKGYKLPKYVKKVKTLK